MELNLRDRVLVLGVAATIGCSTLACGLSPSYILNGPNYYGMDTDKVFPPNTDCREVDLRETYSPWTALGGFADHNGDGIPGDNTALVTEWTYHDHDDKELGRNWAYGGLCGRGALAPTWVILKDLPQDQSSDQAWRQVAESHGYDMNRGYNPRDAYNIKDHNPMTHYNGRV